nr:MAG TPA: hypothetical protein [Caudoviricetes sp.]
MNGRIRFAGNALFASAVPAIPRSPKIGIMPESGPK